MRLDIDKNPYNNLIHTITDSILSVSQQILNYPIFDKSNKDHQERICEFICQSFCIQEVKLTSYEAIFTYSTLLYCLVNSAFLKPFWN